MLEILPFAKLAAIISLTSAGVVWMYVLDRRLHRLEKLVTQYASIDNRNLANQRLMNDSVIAYSQRTDVRIMNLENAVSTLAIKQGLTFGGESVRH